MIKKLGVVLLIFFAIGWTLLEWVGYSRGTSIKMTEYAYSRIPTKRPTSRPTPTIDFGAWLENNKEDSCPSSREHVGEIFTCRLNNAVCEYAPSIPGKPTFCNDAPYPNHSFTLVLWGRDWSRFDGKDCMLIVGLVQSFRGEPQIVFQPEQTPTIYECE